MAIAVTPYIHFVNNAEEAIAFYKGIFGAKAEVMHFSDMPQMPTPDQFKNQVMHSELNFDGTKLYISDSEVMGGVKQDGENISLSLTGDTSDRDKLTEYFNKLAEGGEVTDKLDQKPWGAEFGMLKDKFGISWMVNIDHSSK